MSASNGAASAGTEAAGRVADVLALLAATPGTLGVSEAARELGLSKAVVHRILQSLASRRLVRQVTDTREYAIGQGALMLGVRALRDFDLRRNAHELLRELRDETNETTTLSALINGSRIYLEQHESVQEIKMSVELGRPYPLHAGASGRAILAFLPERDREQVLAADLAKLTPETVADPTSLRSGLARIRAQGWATSVGERQHGAGSVAAPVFNFDGEVVGSISACGPVSRFRPEAVERYIPLVVQASNSISRSLGWDGSIPTD